MIDLEPHSTCVWRRERGEGKRERYPAWIERVCACVVRIGRGATASAKGEAEGTHIFERDAPWTLGLARRPREEGGEREGEISVGPLLCTRGVKQRSQRVEEERSRRGSGWSGSLGAFENTAGNEEVGRLLSD